MKKLFLFIILCFLVIGFNSCSSDDGGQESGTLASSELTITHFDPDIGLHGSEKVVTGTFNPQTGILLVKTEGGNSYEIHLVVEDGSTLVKKITCIGYLPIVGQETNTYVTTSGDLWKITFRNVWLGYENEENHALILKGEISFYK